MMPTYALADTPTVDYNGENYQLDTNDNSPVPDQTTPSSTDSSTSSTSEEPEDLKADTPDAESAEKERESQKEDAESREKEEKEKLKKDGFDTDEVDKRTEELKSKRERRSRVDIKVSQFSKNGALTPNILSGLAGNSDKIFDFNGTVTALPFDKLYGVSARSTTYLGEVPGGMKDFKDSEYPSMNDYRIDGQKRTWWSQPQKISADLTWSKDSTNDLHAQNLVNAPTGFDAMGVFIANSFCMLLMFINGLFISIVGFFITIANFNVKGLMEILQWQELATLFKRLFIGDGFGSISPIFIIALISFMVTIAGMVIKYFRKGNQAARELMDEFLILAAALVIAGIGYSGAYDTLITNANTATVRFMQGINNDMGASSELFTQKTDDPFSDSAATQMALVHKITIDTIIRSEFGYPVSELTLYDAKKPELTAKNWGIDTSEMKRLIASITWSGDEDYIAVHTGPSASNISNPNLGYFWYAVSSGTYHSDPFIRKDKKIVAINGDRNGFLYAIDLLSGIDASSGGSKKAAQIMSNLKAPHMDTASMFLCTLVSIALVGSISTVAIYCLFAKIIFNVGFIFTPVLVIFLLVKPFRTIAQQAAVTWCVSFMKMLISQVILFAVIAATGIFCGYGNNGMILSIIVLAVLSRFIPKLLVAVNGAMSNVSIGGVGQLGFTRAIDGRFNHAAAAISNSKSRSRAKEQRAKWKNAEKAAKVDILKNLGRGNLDTNVTADDVEQQLNNFNQANVLGIAPNGQSPTGTVPQEKSPHDLALKYLSGDNPDIGAVWHNQKLMDSLSDDEQFALRNVVSAVHSDAYKDSQEFTMQQLDLLDPKTRMGAAKGIWDNSKVGQSVNAQTDKIAQKATKTRIYQNYQAHKASLAEKTAKTKEHISTKLNEISNKNKFTRGVSKVGKGVAIGTTFAGRGVYKLGKLAGKQAISYVGAQTGATALYELAHHKAVNYNLSKLQKESNLATNAHTAQAMEQFKQYMQTHNSMVLDRKEPEITTVAKTPRGNLSVIQGENMPSTQEEILRAAKSMKKMKTVPPTHQKHPKKKLRPKIMPRPRPNRAKPPVDTPRKTTEQNHSQQQKPMNKAPKQAQVIKLNKTNLKTPKGDNNG